MIMDIASVSAWYVKTVNPWVDMIISENKYLPYLLVILLLLVGILIKIRRRKSRKFPKGKGGYRNFQGDIWYPDGRIWHAKTKTWEEPDFHNQEKRNP